MTDETKRFIGKVLKASAVGTAIGIPVALAMKHYIPEGAAVAGVPIKSGSMALVLTAIGFAAKEVYFRPTPPLDVASQRALLEGQA
jgi:hypothetical protein